MKKNWIRIVCGALTFIVIAGLLISNVHYVNKSNTIQSELNINQELLKSTQSELANVKDDLIIENEKNAELNNEVDGLTTELNSAKEQIAYLDKHSGAHNGWPMCWREVNLEQWEIDFFAKLLYCEAGSMGHEGQFWTASAILNLSELKQMSIWDMGHIENIFSVAPWVDNATPTQQQYDIIYEVLNNGWIADVSYFRTDEPHTFGKFMIQIENVCFNCP